MRTGHRRRHRHRSRKPWRFADVRLYHRVFVAPARQWPAFDLTRHIAFLW